MLRKFESFLKFSASSIISFVLDYGLFTLLNAVILSGIASGARELFATYGARVVSAVVNYLMNKKIVFKSKGSSGKSAIRYAILSVVQATVSALLIRLLQSVTGASQLMETALKVPVDLLLFLASYNIQKYWVFPHTEHQ